MSKINALLTAAALLTVTCLVETRASTVESARPAKISASQLSSIAAAAAERWEATGLTEAQKEMLRGLRYEVADLDGSVLGAYCEGKVAIDLNAAGQGWFVDSTPNSDQEFRDIGSATHLVAMDDIAVRVDLLSVVLQEQGHALGLVDSFNDASNVMFGFNVEGVRLLPVTGQAEGSVPGSLRGTHFSHYRGGSVTHTVNATGLVTIEVFSVWRSNGIDEPYFEIYTGASQSGTYKGNFIALSNTPTYASGTELGGSLFTVSKQVATFQLASAGTYYATWNSCCRVGGINNAPEDTWELETCIVWDGTRASASPTQREATIDVVAKGFNYVQNLNSLDPDGTPVSYSFLTGSSDPTYGPSSQMPGINLDGIGNVNISAANTATLNLGRWIYKTRVTDGQGAYSDRDVMIVVESAAAGPGANPNPPVLAAIPNQVVAVGSPLTFGVSASDADNDSLTVRAQLLPSGSTLPQVTATGTVTSTFNWTPAAGQEGVYTINVEAFDNVAVPIIASQQVRITVTGANDPPVLTSIGNKAVANGGTLSFTISGSDPNMNALTYSAFFLPAGATFTPATRTFTWTPTAGQYNNTYTNVRFRVTDNGVPNLFAEEAINITVGAGNVAPVIASVATVTAQLNQPLTIPISVTDSAGQTISVTAPILPSGSTFSSTPGTSPVSGSFTWTPTAIGLVTLRIRAEDNGSPILSSFRDISINVVSGSPPVITLNGPNPVTLECFVGFYTELGATAMDPEDGSRPVTISGTVDRTKKGIYTKTYTSTDSEGATTVATRTINVVDTLPPVVKVPSDIIVPSAVGGLSGAIFYSPPLTASDICQGNVLVISSHPSGTKFPVGSTTVTCTATDNSGNSATATFNVVVLKLQPSPGTRYMDAVSLRGDTPVGTAGTVFNVNNAFLNNNSDVIYDARLTGAGANDAAVFFGPAGGAHIALAVKGTASGDGNFGAFSKMTLNNLGHKGFESLIGTTPGQFADIGSGSVISARKGGAAATGGGETYNAIYQPAMASDGQLLTPAYLLLGSGAGVTVANDTLISSSAGTVVAREGSPSGIAATSYGQLHQRVVTSTAGEKYSFTAFLEEAVFNPATNTGLFVGTLGSGPPALAVREGDATNGVTGGKFFQFLGEAVNSAGAIALRANITGTGITSLNNAGIWTNAPNTASPPVLVAKEGAVAPVAPANKVVFGTFSTLHMNDDGSVVFFAFLKNATTTPVPTSVTSANDGSIWRWSAGKLSLIAREGDLANNTAGARLQTLYGFDCNDVAGVVFDSTLIPGVGDTTTATNQAVFVDRGASDPAPLLVMRRSDTFDVDGTEHSVAGIKISTEVNSGGGTGGYGRAINDFGDVVFNLTLSGNKSGIFVLGTPPVPAP